jgi:hypothetical protein
METTKTGKTYYKDVEKNYYYILNEKNKLIKTVDLTRKDCVIYIYYKKSSKKPSNHIEVDKEYFTRAFSTKIKNLRQFPTKYYQKSFYKDKNKSYIKTKIKWDVPSEVVVLNNNELSIPEPLSWKDKLENFKTLIVSSYNKVADYIEDLD